MPLSHDRHTQSTGSLMGGGDWEIWASPSVHVAISQSSDLLTQHTKNPKPTLTVKC